MRSECFRLCHVMAWNFLFALSITLTLSVYFCRSDANEGKIEEFCIWETFKPECPNGEVLVIKEAKHGRMNVGKCLTMEEIKAFGSQSQDPRFLGCHNDVTDILNSRCAMQSSCEIKIIDLEKKESTTCLPGLKMFLEVKFMCISVVAHEDICRYHATGRAKYFYPKLIETGSCASQQHPLTIESEKGQRIKISIDSFALYSKNIILENSICEFEIGMLINKKSNTSITICRGGFMEFKDFARTTKFITSTDNIVNLFLYKNIDILPLFRIEVEGCLDIIPPENTWLKRSIDDIVIGCYSSKQTWYLKCEKGGWKGAIGNCSASSMRDPYEALGNTMLISKTNQVLIIFGICVFGIVTCLTTICIGRSCLKNYTLKVSKECRYFHDRGDFGNTINHRKFSGSQLLGRRIDATIEQHVRGPHFSENI